MREEVKRGKGRKDSVEGVKMKGGKRVVKGLK